MSGNAPVTPDRADRVWAKVPEYYKNGQGADLPLKARVFSRRHNFNMAIEGGANGDSPDVHVLCARIRAHSQNPQIALSLPETDDPRVVFTAETCKLHLAVEGEEEYGELFSRFRTHHPDLFMFYNQNARRYEGCLRAMIVVIEVDAEKCPTIIGFPDSPLDTEQDNTWNALKSAQGGSMVYLSMPVGNNNLPDLNGAISAILNLAPVVRTFGSYWYREYQSPGSSTREAPKWLYPKGGGTSFQKDPTDAAGAGAFIDHHERQCRLTDGSWIELREQEAQFQAVFNLDRTHKASFESLGHREYCLDVTVVDSVGRPSVPEGTRVELLLNEKAPVLNEVFYGRSIAGRIIERNSPRDFSVIFHGEKPLNLSSAKLFNVILTIEPDTTTMKRQIDALQISAKAILPGDKKDGRGKGISLQRTVLAHRLEMDPKSELYFELSFEQLAQIPSEQVQPMIARLKTLWDKELDPAQKAAVKQSVERIIGGLSLIEGPPGCGKSFVGVHIIIAALVLRIPILLTAASNKAVDNLLAALYRYFAKHPELQKDMGTIVRVRTPVVQIACLRNKLGTDGVIRRNMADPETCVQTWEAHNRVVEFAQEFRDDKDAAPGADEFLKLRDADLHEGLSGPDAQKYQWLYNKLLSELLKSAHLVATTLNNAGTPESAGFKPAVMVCDEAGQCHEGDTMIGKLHGSLRAVVLIGDPQQLEPTVLSLHGRNEHANFLKRSLLSRLMQAGYQSIRLRINHRNHPHILDFFNRYVYQGELQAGKDNTKPQDPDSARVGLAFDAFMASKGACKGGDMERISGIRRLWLGVNGLARREDFGTSWENEAQASAVVNLVRALTTFVPADGREGIYGNDIIVLSPYLAQQRLCQVGLSTARLTVGSNLTVEAAQGQEAPIVIFMVTKPSKERPGEIGFVADSVRLNIAMSRAKQVLIIVGDFLAFTSKVRQEMRRKKCDMLLLLLLDVQNKNHLTPIHQWGLQPSPPVAAGASILPWRPQVPVHRGAPEVDKPGEVLQRAGDLGEPLDIDEEDARLEEEIKAAEEKVKELKERLAQRQRERANRK